MLYLKYFILYSIIGFTFESFIFKISKSNKYSGILNGPYTTVYGFGGCASIIINNFLNNVHNKYLNFILCYIFFVIICTLIEFLGGHIINLIFKTDSWNYSNHKFHFGKYICLSYALIWGGLATIFVKLSNSYFNNILNLFPNYLSIIIFSIMIIDFIFKLIEKDYFISK